MLMQAEQTVSFHPIGHCNLSFALAFLWVIPALPIVASGVIALLKQPRRKTSATLAIGSLSLSLLLSLVAFVHVVGYWARGLPTRDTVNFTWLQFGTTNVDLGGCLIRYRR